MHLPDSYIWTQCINGDNEAFRTLYTKYYPLLFNFGLKIENNRELVEDCVQELFVKLITNHEKLPAEINVKAYLLKAVRNKIIDTIRSQKKFEPLEQDIDQYLITEEPLVVEGYKKLSRQQQKIVYLYYVQDLSHDDISKILDINYQSSKNLLSRAILKLRNLFLLEKELSVIIIAILLG